MMDFFEVAQGAPCMGVIRVFLDGPVGRRDIANHQQNFWFAL